MPEPFVGEIRLFGGYFAPTGWALCDGQLLAISQNDVLFSLLGTYYGGDGRTTFGLPDLRGRVPLHQGQSPGLTDRQIGAKGGLETVSLSPATTPAHHHPVMATSAAADSTSPANALFAGATADVYTTESNAAAMNASMVQPSAAGEYGHPNIAPALCVQYIIALTGIYPSRQ